MSVFWIPPFTLSFLFLFLFFLSLSLSLSLFLFLFFFCSFSLFFLFLFSFSFSFSLSNFQVFLSCSPSQLHRPEPPRTRGEHEQIPRKVVLVVNVASLCGLTDSNYKQLAEIYDRLHDSGLEILAFPCNQFGSQEPGGADTIEQTCGRYKVKFDLFDKIDVNGSGAHPIYKWLKEVLPGTLTDGIKWNFTKFLLDRDGKPFKRYGPQEEPRTFEADLASCSLNLLLVVIAFLESLPSFFLFLLLVFFFFFDL